MKLLLMGRSINLQSQHPALTKVACTLLMHPMCSGGIAIHNDYGCPHSKTEKKERTKGSLAYNSSETQPGRCWEFLDRFAENGSNFPWLSSPASGFLV